MKRNYINILMLLIWGLCFSAQLCLSSNFLRKGERENEFIKDNIAYKISENTDEVFVIENYNRASFINIPETVCHCGKTYFVIGITDKAFSFSEVEFIHLPNTIKWIDEFSLSSRYIKKVNIPESTTKIGKSVFGAGINSMFIPHNLTYIAEGAFNIADNLEFFQVDSLNPAYTAEDGVLYDKSKTILIAYPASKKAVSFRIPDRVTHIAEYAFMGAKIDSLFIPNSVISIGHSAFSKSKLSNVVLPKNIIEINNNIFGGCINLISIVIPESVTSIGNRAFSYCSNLTSVAIPESVTDIKEFVFEKCSKLRSIYIPIGVTTIGREAFSQCDSLHTIRISDSAVIDIYPYVFHSTAWYKSQKDGVVYIGKALYRYKGEMQKRTEITIPDGIRSITSKAFNLCNGLVKITLPESLEHIGNKVFEGCRNLKSINIPQRVKTIHQGSFSYSGLRKINVYWEDPLSVNIIYYNGNFSEKIIITKKCKLIVPKGTKEKYEQLEAWKNFKIEERRQ